RDALLAERDQMAALLKLNESERVRLLIKQNMELGRNLKTASDRLIEVHSDNNATQDDLIEAKRDIAHAKGRLIDFQRENASQKNRLSKLEERLRHAGNDLETGLKNTAVDPKGREEMEMLRGIISRQLRVQEHRKLSKEAVMTEVRRMAKEDNILIPQLNGLFEQELRLTAEESELIKEFKIDEDFIFSDRPNRREFVNAGQELQQSISIKDKVARRAYANERFLAAREVFESILAEHPGHVETILNLGVVHVKNNEIPLAIDSFNNAIVIRGENLPFAQFMLGVCHYRLGEFQESNTYLRKSLELENDNAQAYIFLGSVAGREMKHEEAEVHFKTAISIDPTLAQPYYNLAVIYLDKGDKQEALKYYREALKRGADPDLKFEASLAMRN
ncbi:MAG: tetratricopeptide repeat protein, partial [Akkermansiaceae bacterium]